MYKKNIVFFFLLTAIVSFAQSNNSKADGLFYSYAYADAVVAYQNQLSRGPLTDVQYLNLADSYQKLGNYKDASKYYLDVFKRDSTMSNFHFNKMLQSVAKTSGANRVKAFLATKNDLLSNELVENADFNFELIESNSESELNFDIFNLNENTPQADFSPTFYEDKLLFTSGRSQNRKIYAPSGESYLDIYVARMNNDGNVFGSVPFTGIPKSSFHEATPFYSNKLKNIFYVLSNADGKSMLYSEEGKNSLAIGMANENGVFRFLLKDLGTSFYYPFYEDRTEKLYFVANFDDSYGGTDIYYVYTNNGQIMSAPVNLGPRINSPGNEIAPYIFENSLYFSSDIFYGYGGMDVYKSNFQSDDSFSIPINLGKGINSFKDDFGFILRNNNTGGLLGYFSSNRDGGKGNDDIYGFNVVEKPGLKTIAIRGNITKPNSRAGIAKATIKVFDENGTLIKEVFSDEDGKYQFEVPWRNSIRVEASKDLYSVFKKELKEEVLESVQKETLDFEIAFMDDVVEEKEKQDVLKLKKFYFDKGRSNVNSIIAFELDKVVEVIKQFPEFQLRIESHTDSRGGSSTNFRLSQQRSDAIKRYLIQQGVSTSNILYAVGYGEQKITNNCTNGKYCLDMLHKQNERSLIVVLNYNLLH